MYTKKDPFSLTWCGLFIYFFCTLQDSAECDINTAPISALLWDEDPDEHPFSFPRTLLPGTAADISDSRTWSAASHWTCEEPGNVSLLLTKQSLLWSCNRKPRAETSTGRPVRNPETSSREEAAREKEPTPNRKRALLKALTVIYTSHLRSLFVFVSFFYCVSFIASIASTL